MLFSAIIEEQTNRLIRMQNPKTYFYREPQLTSRELGKYECIGERVQHACLNLEYEKHLIDCWTIDRFFANRLFHSICADTKNFRIVIRLKENSF